MGTSVKGTCNAHERIKERKQKIMFFQMKLWLKVIASFQAKKETLWKSSGRSPFFYKTDTMPAIL